MLTIGFNSTRYSISENGGSVLLTVHALEKMFGKDVTVHVRLTTLQDTANGTIVIILASFIIGGIIMIYNISHHSHRRLQELDNHSEVQRIINKI